MRAYKIIILFILIFSYLIPNSDYESLDIEFLEKNKKQEDKPKNNSKKKSFEDIIKDYKKIEGLYDFYWNVNKNKCYLSIHPDQLDEIYLASFTRQSGDGYRYDGSSMLFEFPYSFKKIGTNIHLISENVLFRANKDSAIYKAVDNHISNSIFSVSKIEAISDTDSLILIDGSTLLFHDFMRISTRGKYLLDKKNSFFNNIKSFEHNSEIDFTLHYIGKKTNFVYTLPNSGSMLHKYHISLSEIQDNDYKPRLLDDRIGHFETMYQDYSNTLTHSPYVRYINRWNLKKKDPKAELSEPITPIIFWLENTIPHEFRNAVRDGILGWNNAFEAIGFKNAIVVKQMEDDASWDPADIRYNTIRWMVQPGAGYAVGPSRANPFTGELYDADIRISADYVRFFFTEYDEFIQSLLQDPNIVHHENEAGISEGHICNYAKDKKNQMAFIWNYMTMVKTIENTQEALNKFIYQGIVDLILHEVGHTLGLRHNFRASSVYSVEQLSDSIFTTKNGTATSVMDYNPANTFDNGDTFFLTKPGKYDFWAIEYAYSTCENYNDEETCLRDIMAKSTDPELIYATDEDTNWGNPDPLTNRYDMSSDPIKYYSKYLDMIQIYWEKLLNEEELDGEPYYKIRNKFSQGLYEYFRASRQIPKFIGGVYFSRHHIGDLKEDPFVVVDAHDQKRAIDFLETYVLSENAFDFPSEILNKLVPTRLDDFEGTLWDMDRLDYPIHKIIKNLQIGTLNRMFSERIITRLHDNELKFKPGEEKFSLAEFFDQMNKIVWAELTNSRFYINSFRRELQNAYIEILKRIYLSNEGYPIDAKNLAYESMNQILELLNYQNIDTFSDVYTSSHLKNMKTKLESILEIESSEKF